MSEEQFLVSPAGKLIDPRSTGSLDENPSTEEKVALARRQSLHNILTWAERRVAVSRLSAVSVNLRAF